MYQVSLTPPPTITHTHTIPGEDAAGKRTRHLSGGGVRCLTDRTTKEVSESQSINRDLSSLHTRELPNPAQPAPLYTRTHTHTPRVRSRSLSPSKLCPFSPSESFSSLDAHCPEYLPRWQPRLHAPTHRWKHTFHTCAESFLSQEGEG